MRSTKASEALCVRVHARVRERVRARVCFAFVHVREHVRGLFQRGRLELFGAVWSCLEAVWEVSGNGRLAAVWSWLGCL